MTRNILSLVVMVCLLSSCGTYAYVSNFEKGNNNHKNYDTAVINIQPRVSGSAVFSFDLVNKSNKSYKILWEESSVNVNGNVQSLRQQLVALNATTLTYNTTNIQQPSTITPIDNVSLTGGNIGIAYNTTFIPPQTFQSFNTVNVPIKIWKSELQEVGSDTVLKHEETGKLKLKVFETKDIFKQQIRAYITLVNADDPKEKIVFDEQYFQKNIIRVNADKIHYLHQNFDVINTRYYEPKGGTKFVYGIIGAGLITLLTLSSMAEDNTSQ